MSPHACAVCAQILVTITGGDGTVLARHPRPADHPAMAVPAEQIHADLKCDVCSDALEGDWWELPVESFTAPGHDEPWIFEGDWALCPRCHDAYTATGLDGLTDRAATANKRPRATMAVLFDALAEHTTGPPRFACRPTP